MAKVRSVFPGGNTCYGFYSFYEHMTSVNLLKRKYVLKGGPGVGKSTFMKKIGADFETRGYDVEYHWCSSDNNSLDGIVIENAICVLDGTAPHIVDPVFPGAVDEIINLGQFWNRENIARNKDKVIGYTQAISQCFKRAYMRLSETNYAYQELKSYYEEAADQTAVKRNITALAEDFLQGTSKFSGSVRHLFPAAITPEGLVTKVETIVKKDMSLFTVKGNPGSGVKSLFDHVLHLVEVNGIHAEVFHNPFNPDEIDLIILPETNAVLIDLSDFFFEYSKAISGSKYKRQLDFNKLVNESVTDMYVKNIDSAQSRIELGLIEAVKFIAKAKSIHDELEQIYIPSMDFDAIETYRKELVAEMLNTLT